MTSPSRPPRLAAWLLSIRLDPDDRDQVVGDLAEDFGEIASRRGRPFATRWYWRQAISLGWRLGTGPNHSRPERNSSMSLDQIRHAVRRLARQPGAAAGSVMTLALAIGAGVAAWSLLSAVLLHPLPLKDDGRLFVVGARRSSPNAPADRAASFSQAHTYPAFPVVRDSGVFDAVDAFGKWNTLVATTGPASFRPVLYVTHGFFDTLGLRVQAGRDFLATDDQRGAPPVVVLSDRLWRTEFDAKPDVLGTRLAVGNAGAMATIVGIAPKAFRGPDLASAPDLYLPFHIAADLSGTDFNPFAEPSTAFSPAAWVHIVGRLKPGVGVEATAAGLATLVVPEQGPRDWNLTAIQSAALAEAARPKVTEFARLLAITVGLLLLTGCLTVGMLLLLRTEARRDEFATCLALGATRAHLAVGVLVEGALLAGAGAALAVPLSWWLLSGLRAFELPGGISMKLMEIPVDGRTFAVAGAAAVLATMALALVAGVFGLSANVADSIRSRSGATQRVGRRRTRAILVVAEIAVALVLLAGAGLFIRSLSAALQLNAGFDVSRIASGSVSLRSLGYSPERAAAFFDELRARLAANPAIRSASMTLPQGGMSPGGRLVIDGVPRTFPSFVGFTAVDDRYLSTMGLRVTEGRDFSDADTADSARVILVSESFGRVLANGGNPIGHRIRAFSSRPGQPPAQLEIVGVVSDIVVNVNTLEPLAVYLPISQVAAAGSRTVVIRARGSAASAAHETVGVVRALVPALAPPEFTTMDGNVARQMGPQRFGATVLGALGVIAAVLTLFGTYVLAESMSAIRRREMGIRAALGATEFELSRLIMGETTRLVAAGVLLGAILSWFGAGLIRSFLYQVQPFDAPTVAIVISAMVMLALAVTLKPALRAGRVDLSRVLRDE